MLINGTGNLIRQIIKRSTGILRSLIILNLILFSGFAVTAELRGNTNDADDSEFFEVRMQGSLWETLKSAGVNPTMYQEVFDYNKQNNPRFRSFRSYKQIGRGTVIYIPNSMSGTRGGGAVPVRSQASWPSRATIVDTVVQVGVPLLVVKTGRGQSLNTVIQQLCLSPDLSDQRDQSNLVRNIRSDMHDIYIRIDRDWSSYSSEYLIPLHFQVDRRKELIKKIDYVLNRPEAYVRRDSIIYVNEGDIVHLAGAGESYLDLARRYCPPAESFPARYPYHKESRNHLRYMSQIIKHYNLNQAIHQGRTYFIPYYLKDAAYYRLTPEISAVRQTKSYIEYSNGLKLMLDYHVTRKKEYWKNRQKYILPLKREMEDGSLAYPDMILWHRTGLDPEIEDQLREKGRKQFSLKYIYRLSVANYYIDEDGNCYLIVDTDKNPRDHAGHSVTFRSFWNGEPRVSDVSIGIEIESGFLGDLNPSQLATARKLNDYLRSSWIIDPDRNIDHRKVGSRIGPDLMLTRGRKSDGLTLVDRRAIGIEHQVLDVDVLRGLVDPNLDELQERRLDIDDFWFGVYPDPDLEISAQMVGWKFVGGQWIRPGNETTPSKNRSSIQITE